MKPKVARKLAALLLKHKIPSWKGSSLGIGIVEEHAIEPTPIHSLRILGKQLPRPSACKG